jgi:DNA repair photolyase
MIISASRRTDIPAFYSEWFIKRIEKGFFYNVNPFNAKKIKYVSLAPDNVDVIVFWSKNPKPILKYLPLLDSKGYSYYFQFTLNYYPKTFEPHIPDIEERVDTFKVLSQHIGKHRVIWRYDPIILSSITPYEYHLENIYKLSSQLSGYTNRLMISFVDFYGKVKMRLAKLQEEYNIEILSFQESYLKGELHRFAEQLSGIVTTGKIDVYTCAEIFDLDKAGVRHRSCIDGSLINKIFKTDKIFVKDKGQRKECLCAESIEMGMYDTCKFKCNYCYANTSPKRIDKNVADHFIDGPSLICNEYVKEQLEKEGKKSEIERRQFNLF